ncbi:MAG: ribosome maturation factor RimP [Alphaproteobacteria bacterium]|nr:ribosome maturation factor RimP [Alphaproteobacteria bacterium]MBN2779831.1 ribosome maturation factor RimP [Alphaproteobacteria bacterium]
MDLQKISNLITPVLIDNGYTLVDIIAFQRDTSKVLDLRLERKDLAPLTLEDCQKASRTISAVLDVEDAVNEKYILEVGSAGINRPLKTQQDFKRFIGKQIKIETLELVEDRRRFKGELLDANEMIKIKTEDGIFEIAFDNVEKAKLNVEI